MTLAKRRLIKDKAAKHIETCFLLVVMMALKIEIEVKR